MKTLRFVILPFLTIIILTSTLFVLPCGAKDANIYATATFHSDTELVVIKIYLDRSAPLCGLQISLELGEGLTPNSCTRGDALTALELRCKLSDSSAILLFFGRENCADEGLLVTLCFSLTDPTLLQETDLLAADISAISMCDGSIKPISVNIALPSLPFPDREESEADTPPSQTERESECLVSEQTQITETQSESETVKIQESTESEAEAETVSPPLQPPKPSYTQVKNSSRRASVLYCLVPIAYVLSLLLYALTLLPYFDAKLFFRRIF